MSASGRTAVSTLSLTVLAVLVVTSCAEHLNQPWQCPQIPGQIAVTLNKMMGTWYDFEAFPTVSDDVNACYQSTSTRLSDDGKFRIVNKHLDVTKSKIVTLTGDGIQDPIVPSRFLIEYTPFLSYLPYWVLTTDYNTYALVWYCFDFNPVHYEMAIILTRERGVLNLATRQSLYDLLERHHVNATQFLPVNQANCPI